MSAKKAIFLAAVLFVIFGGFFWLSEAKHKINSAIILSREFAQAPPKGTNKDFLETGFWDYKDILPRYFLELSVNRGYEKKNIYAAVTSHHFPLAFPFIAQLNQILGLAAGPRQIFVIVGPDHFERCGSWATVSDFAISAPSGFLEPDKRLVQNLVSAGAKINNDCFDREHAILTQAIFLAHLFPDAKIAPLLFSAMTPDHVVKDIADSLANFDAEIFLLGSIDFSHYKTLNEARNFDRESQEMIIKGELDALTIDNLDSPPAMKLINYYAEKKNAKPEIIGHANSFDFNGSETNTTSYFNIIYTGLP